MQKKIVRAIADRLDRYSQAKVLTDIAQNDDMLDPKHPNAFETYMEVGRDAIGIMAEAMMLGSITTAPVVLDLPCGFGRVTRHISAFLPASEVYVADLQTDGVQFCRERMGAIPLEASKEFQNLDFGLSFDLIWSGSLLTHLDLDLFDDALRFFARSLAPNGIAVVTLHGRYSPFLHHHHWKYCSKNAHFEIAETDFEKTGFGYVNYEGSDRYGVSLSSLSFTASVVAKIPGIRIVGYHERRWSNHQDVLVLRKADIFE